MHPAKSMMLKSNIMMKLFGSNHKKDTRSFY